MRWCRSQKCRSVSLSLRFHSCGSMRPAGLEFRVGNPDVARNVLVLDDEIVAGAGLKKLLLRRKPCGFVAPELDFRELVSNVVRFRQQLQQYDLPVVERLLTLQSDEITLLEVRSRRPKAQQQKLVHN